MRYKLRCLHLSTTLRVSNNHAATERGGFSEGLFFFFFALSNVFVRDETQRVGGNVCESY